MYSYLGSYALINDDLKIEGSYLISMAIMLSRSMSLRPPEAISDTGGGFPQILGPSLNMLMHIRYTTGVIIELPFVQCFGGKAYNRLIELRDNA